MTKDTILNIKLAVGFTGFGLFLLIIAQIIAEAFGISLPFIPTRGQLMHNQWYMLAVIEMFFCCVLVYIMYAIRVDRHKGKLTRIINLVLVACFLNLFYNALKVYQANFLI